MSYGNGISMPPPPHGAEAQFIEETFYRLCDFGTPQQSAEVLNRLNVFFKTKTQERIKEIETDLEKFKQALETLNQ